MMNYTNREIGEITRLLQLCQIGDKQSRDEAKNRLFTLVYEVLKQIAASACNRNARDQISHPTDLVGELFIRLGPQLDTLKVPNRRYFFGAVSNAIKRILLDRARKTNGREAGGANKHIPLDDIIDQIEGEQGMEFSELYDALEQLKVLDDRLYQTIDMKYFLGMKHGEIAEILGVSLSTVEKDLLFARSCLRTRIWRD